MCVCDNIYVPFEFLNLELKPGSVLHKWSEVSTFCYEQKDGCGGQKLENVGNVTSECSVNSGGALKSSGHQQMQDMLCDVGKVSQNHLETSLRLSDCSELGVGGGGNCQFFVRKYT